MKLLVALLASAVLGLRFDIAATQGQGTVRCLEQTLTPNTLVRGKVEIPTRSFQTVDFMGVQKFSFTTNDNVNIHYCFTATLDAGQAPGNAMKRTVFLHVETGKPMDLDSIPDSTKDRFTAIDTELNYLTTLVTDAYQELVNYDTADHLLNAINEDTKERVFNSSSFSLFVLIALGLWEIWYLHSFFRAKNLI